MCPFHLIAHEASNLEQTQQQNSLSGRTLALLASTPRYFLWIKFQKVTCFSVRISSWGDRDQNQIVTRSAHAASPGRGGQLGVCSCWLVLGAGCWCARQRAMNIEYIVYSAYKEQRATWATEEQENMAQNQESVDTELMSREGCLSSFLQETKKSRQLKICMLD